MTESLKMELIKKLENLVAFQTHCLDRGDWEEYDMTIEQVKKIENQLISGD